MSPQGSSKSRGSVGGRRWWWAPAVLALGVVPAVAIGDGIAGAATPTLNGEQFAAGDSFPGTTFQMSVVCAPPSGGGVSSFEFTASGTATGPIPGTFTESGSASWNGTAPSHATFTATFTLTDTQGALVATGTKVLPSALVSEAMHPANGSCGLPTATDANLTGAVAYSVTFATGETSSAAAQVNMSNHNPPDTQPNPGYSMVEGFMGGGPPPPPASLTASPSSNLSDGQSVLVTGANLPYPASYQLEQCVLSGCDVSHVPVSVSSAPDGSLATGPISFTVHQHIAVASGGGTQQIDCAVAVCAIAAIGGPGGSPPYAVIHFGTSPPPSGHFTYTGPTSADLGDSVVLSALLTDASGNPVVGAPVVFGVSVSDPPLCTTYTDSTGVGSCTATIDPNLHAGPWILGTSGGPIPFTITPEETVVAYAGPVLVANGVTVALSGRLHTDDGLAVNGAVITLSLGTQSCTAVTDASGTGTCSVVVAQPAGPISASASFAGNGDYQPSQAIASAALVAAGASGGSFIIGNQNASIGHQVTFWGAQWAKQNNLTGGSAPSSFKGFVDVPAGAASCGAPWSTSPGNSAGPPPTVPAYMTAIVSSSIIKTGSAISGTTTALVIIKTDPGYAGNPGHAGTGTVVAVFPCS